MRKGNHCLGFANELFEALLPLTPTGGCAFGALPVGACQAQNPSIYNSMHWLRCELGPALVLLARLERAGLQEAADDLCAQEGEARRGMSPAARAHRSCAQMCDPGQCCAEVLPAVFSLLLKPRELLSLRRLQPFHGPLAL